MPIHKIGMALQFIKIHLQLVMCNDIISDIYIVQPLAIIYLNITISVELFISITYEIY